VFPFARAGLDSVNGLTYRHLEEFSPRTEPLRAKQLMNRRFNNRGILDQAVILDNKGSWNACTFKFDGTCVRYFYRVSDLNQAGQGLVAENIDEALGHGRTAISAVYRSY
jgi:hypothetical protein